MLIALIESQKSTFHTIIILKQLLLWHFIHPWSNLLMAIGHTAWNPCQLNRPICPSINTSYLLRRDHRCPIRNPSPVSYAPNPKLKHTINCPPINPSLFIKTLPPQILEHLHLAVPETLQVHRMPLQARQKTLPSHTPTSLLLCFFH